jgi:hypothetical protein
MIVANPPKRPTPRGGAWAWAAAVALSTAAWTAWLYRIPADYVCTWGVNPQAAAHFSAVMRVPWQAADTSTFRVGFRVCATVAFVAYFGMLATWLARSPPSLRSLLPLVVATVLVLAVGGPPALSADVYAYVGYARLQLIHHLNPYEATQLSLVQLGDATGPFLRWPISSPYGPLWTLVSMAAVMAFPQTSIMGPLVLLKVIEAAALLWMAEGGRRLAERRAPGRGVLVFAALALNPLFLMEGVVNGHNDIVMLAFVVWALAMAMEQRYTLSFALLGLGTAMKFVPLLLAPWLLVMTLGAARPGRRLAVVAQSIALAMAPLVASFAVFWRGTHLLTGLRSRSDLGQSMSRGDFRRDLLLLLAIYLGLSAWVLRRREKRIVVGWAIASVAVGTLASGISFPWYATWPLAAALVVLEDGGFVLSAALCGLAIAKILQYT